MQGLTLDEARYALRRALAGGRPLGHDSLPAVLEEKRLLVNRSGVIEFVASGTDLDDVGGLEGLKKWLLERRKLFEMRESLDAEIVPKGLLMMGIPGCGKSLCVKAIASLFPASALSRGHDRDLFRPARQSRKAYSCRPAA